MEAGFTREADQVQNIVREAVHVKHQFVDELGINCEKSKIKQYVCFVADCILDALGVPLLYNVPNPFDNNAFKSFSLMNSSDSFPKKMQEPLTLISSARCCLFPIKHQDIWELYELQCSKFWFAKEVNFTDDYKYWQLLSPDEQEFIATTLSFFANADNLVLQNLHDRLRSEITYPEVQCALAMQAAQETIHVHVYNEAIRTVIRDPKKQADLFAAIDTNPIVLAKTQWTQKWIDSHDDLAHRLVAFALVEGVYFSSSFASLFWLRKRKCVPGICYSNEKIVEDEAIHVRIGCLLYREHIKNKIPLEELYGIVREAVQIEHKFVDDALPVRLMEMNNVEMKQYVCFVADLVLELLGVPKLYNVPNPFEWMIGIGLLGKSNFFEKRTSEYDLVGTETQIHTTQFANLGDELGF